MNVRSIKLLAPVLVALAFGIGVCAAATPADGLRAARPAGLLPELLPELPIDPLPGPDLGVGIRLLEVTANSAVAQVELPMGLDADVTLTFVNAQNLTPENLGISARVVDPLDPALRSRLPGAAVSIPSAFPVLITIEPPAAGGLTFANATSVEIHTHNLPFVVGSPLRLYKAPLGGPFYDITNSVSPGSVRTRGTTGGFSQFLIVVDLQPAHDVAEDKYAFLAARLDNPSLSDNARDVLAIELAASRAAFASGDYVAASWRLEAFCADVRRFGGNGVPNQWRAARDLDNISGDLLGEAASLQFTLGRLNNGQ